MTDGNRQLYLIPLEIKLKHSTVHMDEPCPLVTPNPGVAAIHDCARWATEASGDPEEGEGEHTLHRGVGREPRLGLLSL